jgi:hypothetical protein
MFANQFNIFKTNNYLKLTAFQHNHTAGQKNTTVSRAGDGVQKDIN